MSGERLVCVCWWWRGEGGKLSKGMSCLNKFKQVVGDNKERAVVLDQGVWRFEV